MKISVLQGKIEPSKAVYLWQAYERTTLWGIMRIKRIPDLVKDFLFSPRANGFHLSSTSSIRLEGTNV